MTKVLHIDPINPNPSGIGIAAKVIREGGTVAFPTETVYGLGANGLDATACKKIFEAKGRPADNPLILHISNPAELSQITLDSSRIAPIMEKFWPGPVSFVLKCTPAVPDIVTAGLDTVAVRYPAHRIAIELIKASGVPIAAPSANTSTKPSTTEFLHVLDDLDGKVDLIIGGGNATFGIESTILDMTTQQPTLLRPGAYEIEELEKYFGSIITAKTKGTLPDATIPKAPGMKYKHYAPAKKLLMAKDMQKLKDLLSDAIFRQKIAILCSSETAEEFRKEFGNTINIIDLGSRTDLFVIAKNLFASFRKLDKSSAKIGIIETFDERGIGLAIMNRIFKASAGEFIENAVV